ncbi:DUF2917 domain-containing protein [Pelomonas sp. CA6]|uniref:DUF2917 domain-containing protein n=1 Tax=Pelomonas sp. CA6 TaxID=2907999 RepID=UPI001F4C393B|nr:DUF2917 domain-containing protein [Pelomonas sp. CA6]MCH7343083.1 DUF2917 domain-containing protein [Pelomonas sp. CA6]
MDKTEFSSIGAAATPVVVTRHDPQGASWALESGEVLRLPIGPGPRRLRVLEGRIWATPQGSRKAGSVTPDWWLDAGQTLDLPSGAELVIEAWPQARFELLVPPQACAVPRRSARPAKAAGWHSGLAVAG